MTLKLGNKVYFNGREGIVYAKDCDGHGSASTKIFDRTRREFFYAQPWLCNILDPEGTLEKDLEARYDSVHRIWKERQKSSGVKENFRSEIFLREDDWRYFQKLQRNSEAFSAELLDTILRAGIADREEVDRYRKAFHQAASLAADFKRECAPYVEEAIETWDGLCGEGWGLVSFERGPRYFRVLLEMELEKRGRGQDVVELPFCRSYFGIKFWDKGDPQDHRKNTAQFLSQNKIGAQDIISSDKPLVFLDDAYFGTIIYNTISLLLLELEPNEDRRKRLLEIFKNRVWAMRLAGENFDYNPNQQRLLERIKPYLLYSSESSIPCIFEKTRGGEKLMKSLKRAPKPYESELGLGGHYDRKGPKLAIANDSSIVPQKQPTKTFERLKAMVLLQALVAS